MAPMPRRGTDSHHAWPTWLTALSWFSLGPAFLVAGSGVVLIAMGVLVLTGELFPLNIQARHFLDQYDLNFFKSI